MGVALLITCMFAGFVHATSIDNGQAPDSRDNQFPTDQKFAGFENTGTYGTITLDTLYPGSHNYTPTRDPRTGQIPEQG